MFKQLSLISLLCLGIHANSNTTNQLESAIKNSDINEGIDSEKFGPLETQENENLTEYEPFGVGDDPW